MIKTNFINTSTVLLSDKCLQIMGSSRDGKIYELDLVKTFYVKMKNRNNKPTFFDIGGNTGSYSLIPAYDSDVICYSFEPNPHAFSVLKENVNLNNIGNNVHLNNVGMWSSKKQMILKIPIDMSDSGLSTLGENPTRFKYNQKAGLFEEKLIDCITIDEFILEQNILVDAIKIDTEGSELEILKGGIKTLKEQKPLLLLEYDDKNTHQFNYERLEIKKFLVEIGYKNYDMYKLSDIFVS